MSPPTTGKTGNHQLNNIPEKTCNNLQQTGKTRNDNKPNIIPKYHSTTPSSTQNKPIPYKNPKR
jgi:hypothetical protein